MTITEQLAALSDAGNALFTAKLTPGIDPATLLGCRIPQLRQLARRLRGSSEAAAFIAALPHRYHDENNLHGLLLGQIRDPQQALTALEHFLPCIDNWATCDITAGSMTALGRDPGLVMPHIERWLTATHTYTVRFGIVTLLVALKLYLDWRKSQPVYDIVPGHIWGMTAVGGTLAGLGVIVLLSSLPDLVGAAMSPSGAVVADILSRVGSAAV